MSETATLPLGASESWSPAAATRLLRERLTLYRRSQADLSLPRMPAADLYLLANRFRGHGDKVAPVLAEIDAELAAVMPSRPARPRRWA